MNFGLELLGMGLQQPPPADAVGRHGPSGSPSGSPSGGPSASSSRNGRLAAVGLHGNVPGARNADTWASDLQHAAAGDSRLPDPGGDYAQAIGVAPSQLPGTA